MVRRFFEKPGADRQRRVRIEHIGRVEIGNPLVGFREGRNLEVAVDAEQVAHLHDPVGRVHHRRRAAVGVHVGNVCHIQSLRRATRPPVRSVRSGSRESRPAFRAV
jgi:hypothetical protein